MSRRFDAVFFDLGFTLVYFHPSLPELTMQSFREAGVNVDAETLFAVWRRVDREFNKDRSTAIYPASEAYDGARELEYRRRILAELGVRDEEVLLRLRAREAAIYAQPGVIRLFPEVRHVLARLREAGYRLGIISNWSWNLRQRCEQVGIGGAFDIIQGSAYAGCQKPNPCIFSQALEALGVPPQRAIHVGDDYEADVVGARNAGMEAVLIDREGTQGERGCPIIRNLEELFPILE